MAHKFIKCGKSTYTIEADGFKTNIFLKIPADCKIEHYPISVVDSSQGQPSRYAFFELTKPPLQMKRISISTKAELNFSETYPIKIGNFLEIGANSYVNIEGTKDSSVYFEGLEISGNKDLTITFSPSSFEQLTEAEIDKTLMLMPNVTTIKDNSKFSIELSDKSLIKNLNRFLVMDNSEDFGRLDLTKVRYIDIDFLSFYTESKGSTFAFDCDFLKAFSLGFFMTEKLNKSGETYHALIKNVNEKGFSYIECPETSIKIIKSASLITKTEKLLLEEKEKSPYIIAGVNKIETEKNITLKGVELSNSYITSENKRIKIEESFLNKTIINFAKSNNSGNSIRGSNIFASELTKIKGSFKGTLDNCIAENINFGTNSWIFYEELDTNYEAKYLKIQNLTLSEKSILKISDCNSNDKMKKISNSKVEGHFVLDTNVCLDVDSAILKEGRAKVRVGSDCGKVAIENSILSGNNDFRNIVAISCSEIDNSRIVSKDYLKIIDEVISKTDISLSEKDVERYNQQESQGSIIDSQVGQATKDLEIL